MSEQGRQAPVNGTAELFGELFAICKHPAFRIGFLDAQFGRPFNHELIIERIKAETPPGALKRLGWTGELFSGAQVEVAQYRYEEGRLLCIQGGLRCKAWGHPDFPPLAVFNYCWDRTTKERGR